MKRGKLFLLSLAVLVALILAGAGVALAQNSTQPQAGNLYQLFLDKLAANLGIEVSKLEEAIKTAGTQTLDEAAQQGWISSDKAQRMKQAIEQGQWGPMGRFFCGGPHRAFKAFGYGVLQDVANILGMTPRELRDELASGNTLEKIASSKGFTLDQLKEKLLADKKAELDEKVSQGKLTPEKAQQILSQLEKINLSRLGTKGPKVPLTNQ